MLETILTHLHNWFPVKGAAQEGTFSIVSGTLDAGFLQDGQYYRVIGSVFNDGLHRYGDANDVLTDETFTGEIWPLAVPRAVVALAGEIAEWNEKNPATDKISESFGGYSYSKGTNGAGGTDSGWQAAFRSRLNAHRKVSE